MILPLFHSGTDFGLLAFIDDALVGGVRFLLPQEGRSRVIVVQRRVHFLFMSYSVRKGSEDTTVRVGNVPEDVIRNVEGVIGGQNWMS